MNTHEQHGPQRPSLVAELVSRLKAAQAFIASCGGRSAKRLLKLIRATLKRAKDEGEEK